MKVVQHQLECDGKLKDNGSSDDVAMSVDRESIVKSTSVGSIQRSKLHLFLTGNQFKKMKKRERKRKTAGKKAGSTKLFK